MGEVTSVGSERSEVRGLKQIFPLYKKFVIRVTNTMDGQKDSSMAWVLSEDSSISNAIGRKTA